MPPTDQATAVEKLTHASVQHCQSAVQGTCTGNVTQTKQISQSMGLLRGKIGEDANTSGGVCEAASAFWILERAGDPSGGFVERDLPSPGDARLGRESEDLIAAIKAAQIQDARSLITVSPTMARNTTTGTFSSARGFAAGVVAAATQECFFNLGFWFRKDATRMTSLSFGHAAAIHVKGDSLSFFDVNFGVFEMQVTDFTTWFADFYKKAGYRIFQSWEYERFEPAG